MRRIITVFTVAAILAAMMLAMAMPAFANPLEPGPNSFEASYDRGGEYEGAFNFGHCQSLAAKRLSPGAPNEAQYLNPALYFTNGVPGDRGEGMIAVLCTNR